MKLKVITICSSASFYKQALDIQEELQKKGYTVKIPHTANKMKKTGDFNVETYKTWFKDAADYKKKARLMRQHFKKVFDADAILVINYKKNNIQGYIGGNVFMEMALAFYHKKPIYILNSVSKKTPLYEEILGVGPIFLNGSLESL